jgi:hypothetical protein
MAPALEQAGVDRAVRGAPYGGDRGSERHSNSKRRVIEAQGRLDHGQRGELLYLDNDAVSLIGRNLSLPSLL